MDPVMRDKLYPSARLFCNTDFLNALQNSPFRPFRDSKTIVDLQLKKDPDEVLKLFTLLPRNPSRAEYNVFLGKIAEGSAEESDLIQHAEPVDFNTDLPDFMKQTRIRSDAVLDFVADLKGRWKELCREFPIDKNTGVSGVRTSLISLPYSFFIPGGRFRECYYWDTLWIVKGLLACQMVKSAKNSIRNLLYLVDEIGFIPNGNRVYYLNRSQPPMLCEMVRVTCDAIADPAEKIEWLEECLPRVDKEYDWYCRTHSMHSLDDALSQNSLAVYSVATSSPRPESFKEDYHSMQKLVDATGIQDREMYQHLASAAESGWDFSSRWTPGSLEDIRTCKIVPVCLNSILLRAETTLAMLHRSLFKSKNNALEVTRSKDYSELCPNHKADAERYKLRAEERQKRMSSLMWNADKTFWFDFDSVAKAQTKIVSCAGILPVWAGAYCEWTSSDAKHFVDFVTNESGLSGPGGLYCTNTPSKEQWDFPNCWPPLVEMAVEALEGLSEQFPECGGKEAALKIARRFLQNCFRGWLNQGVMHEKYDARWSDGRRGEGGEYQPQVGFGWTNGVVLWLLGQDPSLLSEIESSS